MKEMSREDHLEWCKKRALEYLDRNELTNAFSSMVSDLSKHPETEGHMGIEMGLKLMLGGFLNTRDKMREFIEGFN